MHGIPRIPGDQSLAFLLEGYRFGQHRFDRLGTDAFRTRLMLREVVVLRGAAAARFFYEGERFDRTGALPVSVLHLLQDEGSVQTLSGDAHRVRKGMFLEVATLAHRDALAAIFRDEWREAVLEWAQRPSIVLHREAARVLTRTACQWAGVPLREDEVDARTSEFLAMIDRAGTFGPPNWFARAMRLRTEAWARDVVRDGAATPPPEGSALAVILAHRDGDGHPLSVETAATELLNVLRPTVAVGRFIVFAAWALRRRPDWAARIRAGDDEAAAAFAEEVRRFSPFFPVVGGRAIGDVEWAGERLPAGAWVMLDLFATNRHPALWEQPERFEPGRFLGGRAVDRNALVPQGGGVAAAGHRCPGELHTVDLVAEAIKLLARETNYDLPPQDLRVHLRRMPALPRSGFVMRVRR